MKIKAYAKINLALDVVARREDGYHDLEMIMAPIGLHDLLYIDTIPSGIVIESNNKIMPTDQRNIAYKVAQHVIDTCNLKKGVNIFIYKHIPTQAGLAGGSADGAAVIKAMNHLFRLNLSNHEMAQMTKEIGADIPFCIFEQTAFVSGIGENIDIIENDFNAHVLLVKPTKGVSTKRAFTSLDIENAIHKDCRKMKEAISKNDYQGVIDNLQNTLEQPSMELVKDIKDIKEAMMELGFDGCLMSGSGSCVFALTRDLDLLEKGYTYFKNKYPFVRKTYIVNEQNK